MFPIDFRELSKNRVKQFDHANPVSHSARNVAPFISLNMTLGCGVCNLGYSKLVEVDSSAQKLSWGLLGCFSGGYILQLKVPSSSSSRVVLEI